MRPNPERRYFYARTVGFSRDVLERHHQCVVQDADLASQIPLVKLERNPQMRVLCLSWGGKRRGFQNTGRFGSTLQSPGYTLRGVLATMA